MRSKEKREHIRIPLLSESVLFEYESDFWNGGIVDITTKGVFVETKQALKPNTKVFLNFNLPGDLGKLNVEGYVVRSNWTVNRKKGKEKIGIGVEFRNVSEASKKILDAYVVYLRNKQIISVSKRIIEEFFDKK